MKKIEVIWRPISDIPTEHWDKNDAISPLYLVRCGEKNGVPILGYSNYSFVTKSWMNCFQATEQGVHKVTEWTDVML